ncbi:MAG: Tab2/Atab2 family RNA-binding protein [Microcystaceae cyanobacterium]
MRIWQADFYKHSYPDEQKQIFWELLICDSNGSILHEAKCLQSKANSDWLVAQLQEAAKEKLPDLIQVFRPQSVGLLTTASEDLGIKVEATRRTTALKAELEKRGITVQLDKPPPQALPENLWGEEWRFAALPAGEIIDSFRSRPIPILDIPEFLCPMNFGISSTTPVPGVVIYGGRRAMYLARWLQNEKPIALKYIPTEISQSGGVILETGLVDRWIVTTFEDLEVAKAAQIYEQRKQASKGLHFLLVQPDDSGMTYSGFWLLLEE